MAHKGTLYMIPVTLGESSAEQVISPSAILIARSIEHFVVENEKSARHFLSAIKTTKPIRELDLKTLNTHTNSSELPSLLEPLKQGKDIGVLSEAGCPGVADPGAGLAHLAHQKGFRVVPLIGPSSILLALMASGLNGQQFRFLGYLPSDKVARIGKLKEIEKVSKVNHETQIFIETPYRNHHLLEDVIGSLNPTTLLTIASQITLPDEMIKTLSIDQWKQSPLPEINKKPTIFLILAQ
jgi:16S rRNA (cytidine1402-2'-O)-methyltransferase